VLIRRIKKYEGDEVRRGVRLEIVGRGDLDPDAHRQPLLAPDIEIIEMCEGIAAYAAVGQTVLVTGDHGMTIRAKARDLRVFEMPESLQLGTGRPAEQG
jgi:hypothetical protein